MNNKGITLVALVITVIVLLILAGVGISLITGAEGLFGKTKQAGEMYNNASIEESELLEKLINAIEQNKNNENKSGGESGGGETPNTKFDGKVQTPQLLTGMTAVKLTTSTEKEGLTEVSNPESDKSWYNYENRQWANAITKNSEGQITGYWVWIPRFEYKITYVDESNYTAGGTIDVKFIPTTQTTADSGYKLHPAFLNGTENNFANGEWDKELPGFWVSKFEAGFAGNSTAYPNTLNNEVKVEETDLKHTRGYNYYGGIESGSTPIKYPVFLGKTFTYNNLTIGKMFMLSKSLTKENNPYGLSSKTESHLMKNSEWGAVAYLSYSQYGTNGVEPYTNNVSLNRKVITIYSVTGYAGISASDSMNDFSSVPTKLGDSISNGTKTSYAWYTTNGEKASGTMNITGVYDLNGGITESVAGYIANNDTSSLRGMGTGLSYTAGEYIGETLVRGVPITESTKYSTVYPYDINRDHSEENAKKLIDLLDVRYGDAIAEVSSLKYQDRAWNEDWAFYPSTTQTFFKRGGGFGVSERAGLFNFEYTGGDDSSMEGFRVVLAE